MRSDTKNTLLRDFLISFSETQEVLCITKKEIFSPFYSHSLGKYFQKEKIIGSNLGCCVIDTLKRTTNVSSE